MSIYIKSYEKFIHSKPLNSVSITNENKKARKQPGEIHLQA